VISLCIDSGISGVKVALVDKAARER